MRPDPRKYLWDAQRAVELLRQFSDGKTFVEYEADAMLRSAIERQLEIVGEALNQLAKVDKTVALQIPELGRIVALRNILIHGYAEVDNRLVWQVVTDKLPELQKVLGQLITE
jgi:uncharacterized protein with HEPN domain